RECLDSRQKLAGWSENALKATEAFPLFVAQRGPVSWFLKKSSIMQARTNIALIPNIILYY
ncbi:hypothetical protein A2U01_0109129, partial [Trifolium medium]|nr:hypothetical protein [Trifolium medium]